MNDPKKQAQLKEDKIPLDLVPIEVLDQVAWAFKAGAEKYGAYNWRDSGIELATYDGAMRRHHRMWLLGEPYDKDTYERTGRKVSHLACLMACCFVVLDAERLGVVR